MAVVSKFGDGLGANKFSDAGTYVAPGGAAERYLTHQAALTDAMQASGVSREAIGTVTVDKAAGTLTFNETGVVCTDWQVNTAGKIEGWTVKGLGPIASLMWTEDASGSVGGVEVKLVSAYANPEGLWVVLDITAGGKDIQPDISAILTDTNKRQRQASMTYAPRSISAGTSGYVAFTFEGAKFGGTLTYTVRDSTFHDLGAVKLPIS